MNYTGKDCS